MKVALAGRNTARLEGFPIGDPSWQRWGLALDVDLGPHCDVLFEIHRHYWPPGAVKVMLDPDFNRPVYLDEAHPQIPTSIRYPIEDVQREVTDYLESSIAYMMALAIHQGADTIGLWGISMNGTGEYGYQRPNMEYMIGLAEGRGIKVLQGNDGQRQRPFKLSYWGADGRYGLAKKHDVQDVAVAEVLDIPK